MVNKKYLCFFVPNQKTKYMETKKPDVRDEILDYLKSIERPMVWLATKADINYSTVYSVLRQRTFNFSEENLNKINSALGTNFKTN